MQKKFGSIMDETLLARARSYCKKSNTSISWLLEESLKEYLAKKNLPADGPSSVEASFGTFSISTEALKDIMEEDLYETE